MSENVAIKQVELIKLILQIEDVELLEKIRLVIDKTIEEFELSKKKDLLNELHGVWSDMEEDLEKDIMESRTISERVIDLD